MKKIILLFIVAISLLQAKPTLTPEVKALLNSAKAQVNGVSDEEAIKLIREKNIILIDVRDPNEWKKGVIKADNIVTLSRGFLEVKYPKLILNKYKKTDAFLVYCALEPRSVFATARLKELGFTNVKYLQKGFKNWSKKGLPIKK